jgi:hypothetical protein
MTLRGEKCFEVVGTGSEVMGTPGAPGTLVLGARACARALLKQANHHIEHGIMVVVPTKDITALQKARAFDLVQASLGETGGVTLMVETGLAPGRPLEQLFDGKCTTLDHE